MMRMNDVELFQISYGMAEMAAKHNNDIVSLALTRTSEKIASFGRVFAPTLNEIDKMVINFYINERKV